jgi:hypothetical protein
MAQQTVVKRSTAAVGANTDTTIFTPAAGVKTKILGFYVMNEGAVSTTAKSFELRFGSNIIALMGNNLAAEPIGYTTPQAIIAHEIIGDGVTAIFGRNLAALEASETAGYVVTFDSNYA